MRSAEKELSVETFLRVKYPNSCALLKMFMTRKKLNKSKSIGNNALDKIIDRYLLVRLYTVLCCYGRIRKSKMTN